MSKETNILPFRPDQHRPHGESTLPSQADELGRRIAELRLATALALRDPENDVARLRKLDAIEAVARHKASTLAELRAKAEIAFTIPSMERFWTDNAALIPSGGRPAGARHTPDAAAAGREARPG